MLREAESGELVAQLNFIVPVRHPESVTDWGVVQSQLIETVRSISSQDHHDWVCHVVANVGASLPELPPAVVVHRVDLPLPQMPDRHRETEAFYDAVRNDKGLRILPAIEAVADEDFSMVVDFDDFVSRQLAGMVAASPTANGWYVRKGYRYSGGNLVFRESSLDTICGSTLIIRRGLLGPFRTGDGEIDISKVKRHLGSHIFIKPDLKAAGTPLAPLPFRGAVYRVGNPQSTSGAGDMISEMTPRWLAKKAPLTFLGRLTRYWPITKAVRAEFSLP
jgi:hypothetical protein